MANKCSYRPRSPALAVNVVITVKRIVFVSVLAAVILFAHASSSCALSGDVLLGFCSTYTAPDGTSSTHRGVDLAVGNEATAPRDGIVRFAGRVPGPHGGTVVALTLETAEGVVTMLPFEQTSVVAGDLVGAGDSLGTVAQEGDPSSPQRHLHVGLKKAGVYTDPTCLLVPVLAPAGEGESAPSPARVSEHAAPAAPVVVGAASVPVVTGSACAPVPAAAAAVQAAPAPRAASAGAQIAPGVSVASAVPAAVPVVAGVAVGAARGGGRTAPRSAVPHPAAPSVPTRLGSPASAAGVMAIVAFGSTLLLTRRALARRVAHPPVSDRLGILLQHLKAGDTLCGLTSCSGPLPSQSRGH